VTGRWFSLSTPVFSTNKTDSHDITEILLKVALNTLNQNSSTSANVGKPKLFQDILKIQYPNTNNMLNEISLNANP
jgi:hypothetical protein